MSNPLCRLALLGALLMPSVWADDDGPSVKASCPPEALAALRRIAVASQRFALAYSVSQRDGDKWTEIRRGSFSRSGRSWAFHWVEAPDPSRDRFACYDGHFSYELHQNDGVWSGNRSLGEGWQRVFTPLAFGYGVGGYTIPEVLEQATEITAEPVGVGRWRIRVSATLVDWPSLVEIEVAEGIPYALACRWQLGDSQRAEMQVLEGDSRSGKILRATLSQRFTNPALNSDLLYTADSRPPSGLLWLHPLLDFTGRVLDVGTGLSIPLGNGSRRQVSGSELIATVDHCASRHTSLLPTSDAGGEDDSFYEADCACVSAFIFLRAMGRSVEMPRVMRDLTITPDGLVSTDSLASYLSSHGLDLEVRRLSFDELRKLEGLAVILIPRAKGPDHFTVVQRVGDEIITYDPPRAVDKLPPKLPVSFRDSWSCLAILPKRPPRTRLWWILPMGLLILLVGVVFWRRRRVPGLAAVLVLLAGCGAEALSGTIATRTGQDPYETTYKLSCEASRWRDWRVDRVFSSCACLSTVIHHEAPLTDAARVDFGQVRVRTYSGTQLVWLRWKLRDGDETQEQTLTIPALEKRLLKRLFAREYVVSLAPHETRVIELFIRSPKNHRPRLSAHSEGESLSLRVVNVQPPSTTGAWTADLVIRPKSASISEGIQYVSIRLLNPPERTRVHERIEMHVHVKRGLQ